MFHKRKKLNQRGFTMIELLAAVTIVAIVSLMAIKGVSGMIDRAKEARVVQQQKSLIIAAESYLQANSQLKPKTIGESRIINVMDLKKANYLKADIVNADGESCMEESKVRVYKLSKMEYSYYPYIYCGDEKAPETIEPPKPYIDTYFTDASGKKFPKNYNFNNVSKPRLGIVLKGNKDEDMEIDGYSYAIDSIDSTGRRTVFDSGSLSANRKNEILVFVDLKDYINVSDKTEFYIKIFVRNIHGGEDIFEGSLDAYGNSIGGKYEDKVPPICVELQNQASEGEWINKYSAVKDRTVTAVCEDGDGSGCVRDTFSRSWPNSKQKSTVYGYIRVRDNRGNKTPNVSNYETAACTPGKDMCCARVNVDVVSPTVKMTSFKYKEGAAGGQNIFNDGPRTADNDNETVYINSTDFSGCDTSVSEEGWLNLTNYAGFKGVGFNVEISDDIGIASWTWETNLKDISDVNTDAYSTLSVDHNYENEKDEDGASATYNTSSPKDYVKSKKFTIYFKENGRRKGILTVKDVAGNETKFVISANIDTRPIDASFEKCVDSSCCTDSECVDFPNTGLLLNKYRDFNNENIGEPYEAGTWTNISVIASPAEYVIDYINDHPGSTFKYIVYKENSGVAGHSAPTATIVGPYTTRNSRYYFDNKTSPDSNGKNKIALAVCSQSGNCIQTKNYDVWIDTVAPECNLDSVTSEGDTYDGSYWLRIGIDAIVTAKCKEKTDGNYTKSGCENTAEWPNKFSYTYNFDVGTNKAGAKGVDDDGTNHGAVRDLAGNVTECPANKKVYVDHTAPTCTVSAKLNNSSNYTGSTWGKKGDKITVTGTCSDTGGAGSGSGCMIYNGTNPTFDGTKTSASYDYYNVDINSSKATPFGNNKTARVYDGAGNYVDCSKKTVKLDVTSPECGTRSGDRGKNSWTNRSSVTVAQKCSDNLSGCDFTKSQQTGCDTSNNGKSCTCNSSQKQCSRTYNYDLTSDYIVLYDVAGNSSQCNYNVNRDTNPPSCGSSDKPEPTEYATERTRTVNCNKGTGSAVSPCSQTSFSRTWTFENDGKVDDSYITIYDKANNSKDCPVKVLVNEEPDTNICDLGTNESALFGDSISSSAFSLSTTKTINYKHLNKGNSGNGTSYIEFNVTDNEIYNYFPSTGTASFANHAFGFLATWTGSGKWCHANGTHCGNDGNSRWCYARVCKNEELCGKYLGWTAEAINVEWARQGCPSHTFARCWCSCLSGNIGIDWFN